jgi:c-di-GMP-binding flagellar brake protein YcgR
MFEAKLFQDDSVAPSRERRLFQRLPIAVQMELRVKDNSIPIRLRTADISVGGCYVEMSVTLEPGTHLEIVLWLEHQKLALQGRVVTKHPHFGNGIEFISVTPEGETQLRSFLEKAEHSRVI